MLGSMEVIHYCVCSKWCIHGDIHLGLDQTTISLHEHTNHLQNLKRHIAKEHSTRDCQIPMVECLKMEKQHETLEMESKLEL